MSGSIRPVGVLAVGVGAPGLRLAGSEVRAAWGSGGRGQVGVCDADEDTLTLAWQAAVDACACAGVDPASLDGLWWGTSRPPFAEGPSHVFLSAALGMRPDASGSLCSGSAHAGMEALFGAWDAVAAGHASHALVVVSDALLPGIGTANESSTGAAAAALVLAAADEAPARLTARVTTSVPMVDRYRADAEQATGDPYDGRLFREEVFLPLVIEAGKALGDVESWSVSDPDGKLAPAAVKRLGGTLVSGDSFAAVGDSGAAAALVGAAASLTAPGRLGVVGYGGGRASAVLVDVVAPVPGAATAEASLVAGEPVSYTGALRARGLLEPQSDPIPMGLPPGGAAFVRGNVEMLSLQGARCRSCNTISTPPSIHPTCVGCGGAELDIVALERRGTVQTFVVNQTMPPPFQAPLPIVVLDLADGARLMVQGAPSDASAMAIGDAVELRLRRYALERGIPVYGYKAFRTEGAT